MASSRARKYWQWAFILYGVLSLSAMAGMSIGLGIFMAASLFLFYSERTQRSLVACAYHTPYSWFSSSLMAAALLSLIVAMLFPVEGSQAGPRLASLAKFHYFLYPPLFASAFLDGSNPLEEHPFWKSWAIMGALLGGLAILQFFGGSIFPGAWLQNTFFRPIGGTPFFHAQGLMQFHLSFASCMCFVAAAGWARLLWPLDNDNRKSLAFWGAVAALSSLGVFFSYSRIAFFALALLIVALCFLRRPLVGFLACLATLLVASTMWFFSESLRNRWHMYEAGNYERSRMWQTAWGMFSERPLVGLGFGRTGELSPFFAKRTLGFLPDFTSHAHDNFLDMLASTGLIGTLAFLLWWSFLFWAAIGAFRRAPLHQRWLPAAAIAGFMAFHVNGITQVNFWDGKSEHTLMVWAGLTLALWLRDSRYRVKVKKRIGDFP